MIGISIHRNSIAATTGRTAVVAALLVLLACSAMQAQVPEFPDSLRPQWIIGRSERFSSTHTTSLQADYSVDVGSVNALVRGFMTSSTTLFGVPTTRDRIDALVDVEYELPTGVNLFLLSEGTLTNDVNAGATVIPGINNTAATFMGVGGRFQDEEERNRIGVAVGGTYNRQLNVEDAGGALYGELLSQFNVGGSDVRLEGQVHWYNIAPRHNGNGELHAHLARAFEGGAFVEVLADYELVNTDLYIKRREEDVVQFGGLTYDGLLTRNEERFAVMTSFLYPIVDNLYLDLNTSVGTMSIGQRETDEGLPPLPREPDPFSTSRSNLRIDASMGMQWTPAMGRFGAHLQYSTSEEKNIIDPLREVSEAELNRRRQVGAQNDFVSGQLLLGGYGQVEFSRSDTLFMDGSIAIYRYDTPSPENNFDKDEQTIQWQMRYGRRFSPVLSASVHGQAFLTHLVYLFGENSNDNNWNRIFRLIPAVRYHIDGVLDNYLEAEVSANYTEYDFEGRTQNIRGRSFRELRLKDSLLLQITGSLALSARGDLRISERGSFDWDAFVENPLERVRTEGLKAELQTKAFGSAVIGVGGQLSRVKTYRALPRGGLEPFADRTSFGPTASLSVTLSERSELLFSGWWEHRFEESELVSRSPLMFLTVGVNL